MSIRFLNKGNGGTSNMSLNIFTGQNEPESKDGIWVKADKTIEHITEDNDYYIEGQWITNRYADIPVDFSFCPTVTDGEFIYLFGSYASADRKKAYKYDIKNNTYTRLTDIPYNVYQTSAVLVGSDVYLFGGEYNGGNRNTAYKYDTLTDTYTQITNIPSTGYFCICGMYCAVAIGTDIYLFGSNGADGVATTAYKYNTLTDTYTKLANIPSSHYEGCITSLGTDIYLMGGSSSEASTKAYKYDTLTNTYTRLSDLPYSLSNTSIVGINDMIYLMGGNNSRQVFYKYDTLTDTYTQLSNLPFYYSYGTVQYIDNRIYLIGGTDGQYDSTSNKIKCLPLTTKTYDNNTLIIVQGIYYSTSYLVKLLNIESPLVEQPLKYAFKKVLFYDTTNGLQENLDVYRGNGTTWIKFKN